MIVFYMFLTCVCLYLAFSFARAKDPDDPTSKEWALITRFTASMQPPAFRFTIAFDRVERSTCMQCPRAQATSLAALMLACGLAFAVQAYMLAT